MRNFTSQSVIFCTKPKKVRTSIEEAKLKAAAPELLKVLQNIYNHANLTILQGVLIEEAISKALE